MECGRRAVGEIGEALPVAEEASRFRGSAPIGGHNSGRQSAGATVGNRRPLRWGIKTDLLRGWQEVRSKGFLYLLRPTIRSASSQRKS